MVMTGGWFMALFSSHSLQSPRAPQGFDIEDRPQELRPANMSGTHQALHWTSLNNR